MTHVAKQPAVADDRSGRTAQTACKSPLSVALFLAVAGAGLAADLASKHWVFASMLGDPGVARRVENLKNACAFGGEPLPAPETILHSLDLHRRVCPGVRFTLSTNPGIVFSLSLPRWLVAVATVATIGLVCFFFAASGRRAALLHVALACVLAGAMGNLYDRLFANVTIPADGAIRHQVRDFIDCSGLHYPWIFNIADALLVVGVGMLLLHSFLSSRAKPKRA